MIKYLDITIGIISIVYYIYLKEAYDGMSFDKIFVFIGIILIIYHFIKLRINKNAIIYKLSKLIVMTGLSIFIIVESILVFYPKMNIKDDCDYIIILGAAVKNNKPSLTLKGRLDTAIKYLDESNDDCYIVVSGGTGSGEDISEGQVMENYLIEHGVDKNKILVENKATSTYENFKFSKNKIEMNSKKDISSVKVKVITTDFHSFRSSIIAKRNGYKHITFYTSKSLNQFKPIYYIREFFATIKTIIFDN